MKKDNNLCFFSSPGIEANFIFLSCCFSLFKFNLLTNSLKKKHVLRCNNVLYVRGVPEDEEEDEEIKEDPADKEDDED